MNEAERVYIEQWRTKKRKQKSILSNKFRKLKYNLCKKFSLGKKNSYPVSFSGWGMQTTFSKPPWIDSNNKDDVNFNIYHEKLKLLVKENKFFLSQFYLPDTNYQKILEELKWRSYIIYNSTIFALNFTKKNTFNMVECGVCDGLTIYYALSASKIKNANFSAFLYDSFDEIKEDYLSPEDIDQLGNYNHLDIEQTKKNLQSYKQNIFFNKGYIPDIFKTGKNPKDISWLHIDLNSSKTTIECLKFFYQKINDSGVIIFDDYGAFKTTKDVVDSFLKDKTGHFFNFPTGQAMFIKKT